MSTMSNLVRALRATLRNGTLIWITVAALSSGAVAAPAQAVSMVSTESLVRLYTADGQSIRHFYNLPWSTELQERTEQLLREWTAKLREVPFEPLDQDGRIDYLLLRNELTSELSRLNLQRARRREMEPLLPFLKPIHALETARWRMEKLDAAKAAGVVADIPEMVKQIRRDVEKSRKKRKEKPDPPEQKDKSDPGDNADKGEKAEKADKADNAETREKTDKRDSVDRVDSVEKADSSAGLNVSPALALRTATAVTEVRNALKTWAAFYEGSVPEFSWWLKKPNEAALASLDEYSKFLREEIAGIKGKDEDPLVGDPIGAEALARDIAAEWLAYSAEELLAIGSRELEWCEGEMKKAAAEMGLGDDWKAALARVKAAHVPPGQQDQVVTEEARFAIDFVKSRDLVTIPPLCEELWRTSMLSTEAQKTLPYAAYSGPNMLVAYAREDMKHGDKLMSMRGNNRHFTRIVTPHELIPGHHLEAFMTARHKDYRQPFRTPFFVEGWALYWEIQFWNLGYARTPEERVGMLFWRMHRCARIIVSLRFHLGQMTPDQMVEFIVNRVGHERLGAASEVRRFIGGNYSPLYQCAYMIGGLQLKALRDEMVRDGRMSDRQFNDAVLRLGAIPIELVRATLQRQPLTPETKPAWRALAP